MYADLKLVTDLFSFFEKFKLAQVLHVENAHALSNLASSNDLKLLMVVPIEHLLKPSITTKEVM